MSQVVASYQVSAFTVPANLTTADADQVRGNDNTLRASLNNHDGDAGVHFQGSTLAARPVAGNLGRKWLTTDDRKVWLDDGSSWQEIAYAATASPTFTGTVTGAALTLSGLLTGTAVTLSSTITLAGGIVATAASFPITAQGSSGMTIVASHAAGSISFTSGGTSRWIMQSTGHFVAATDNSYDIGTLSNSRPRNVYVGSQVFSGGYTWAGGTNTLDNVSLNMGGNQLVGTRKTGWTTDPTGTLTRTTFDSTTVTLPNLAARVAAIIVDLRSHGLIGT